MATLKFIRRVEFPATLTTTTRVGDQVQTTEQQIVVATTVQPDGTIQMTTDQDDSFTIDFAATELSEAWQLLTGTPSAKPDAEQYQESSQ